MKLTIEIPDSALRAAVEAEVGRAIAKVSEDVIQAKLDVVLAAKLEHMQKKIPAQVGIALQTTIANYVTEVMGVTAGQRRDFVGKTTAGIIAETLRKC